MYLGSDVDEIVDKPRILNQISAIRDYMLSRHHWRSLAEIENDLGYPQASISANLRHLRKRAHGHYKVDKRRRFDSGTWEYRVLRPVLTAGMLEF